MRARNVFCNSYNTRPLLCARITCYVTVITVEISMIRCFYHKAETVTFFTVFNSRVFCMNSAMNVKEIWIAVLIFKSLIKPYIVPFIPGTPSVATLHFTYWVYQCRLIQKCNAQHTALSEVQCHELLHCQSLVWYHTVQFSQTIILMCLIHLTLTEQVGLVVTYFEYPWICLRLDSVPL
jgi:hypothetical protein